MIAWSQVVGACVAIIDVLQKTVHLDMQSTQYLHTLQGISKLALIPVS